ncbi:GntR family transcriptional regulator [Marinobacterium rhizophilum]|uniref:GntR family transcriptional regulator n=1 Tax=Marinobacterium rhizophilum TaxID=420402 RepID=A0ABY5HLH7_9GAMM|nr:GntR family transcriptional regulator [Marinobacterium rhizophilum]UTW12107.1 GntR family transcriptional regulator [Marinobacterium rhizophilum]
MSTQNLTNIEDLSGSLAQRVYQSLHEAILSMDYPPGTILRKGAICEQLGVSRSPVSEAIARLSADGLVDVIPQSATKVSCLSMDEIREASFLREALELAAVSRVAERRSDEQLTQLTRNLRLQELLVDDGDFAGFYAADEEFHALLMEFTGFPGVSSVAASVSLQLKRARMLLLPEAGRPAEAVKEHKAVVDAIRASDPGAAQAAMKHHLGQLISQIEPLENQHPDLFRSR